jgi:protein-disulfide isomerase
MVTQPIQWRVIAAGFSHVLAFALGMVATTALLAWFGIARPLPQASAPEIETNATAQPAAQATALPVVNVADTLANTRENMRLGSATAPVQIVVFADPQCPFCKQSALETERQIIAQYVDAGQASLVYRHFTFLGAESQRIAVAMECAGEQGGDRFWAFHGQVFEHQFPENSGQANDAALAAWADAAGVDASAFKACITNPEMQQRVERDTATGHALGVLGTPTLFVNGRPMPGAVPFAFLKETIDGQLAAAAKK